MLRAEFEQILENRISEIRRVLGLKAAEYVRNEDRLSNFKRAAAMLQTNPESALLGMLSKHLVSIMDMVDDLSLDITHPAAMWNEKIGDAINYLVLLDAMVQERMIKRCK